jgi:hypothetical protein
MNIQFGEKLLHFSPTLAAQIGLDEAVLAQLVFELSHICPTKTLESVDWFYLAPERWPELVPFWNMTKINAIFLNLEQLKIVERHFNPNGQFLIRLMPNNAFHPAGERANSTQSVPLGEKPAAQIQQQTHTQVNSARQRNQAHSGLPTFMIEQSQQLQTEPAYKSAITQEWTPDKNFLVPRLVAENIPGSFVGEQLPNFIGHHVETGTLAADWNSRFVRWVKEEWAKLARPGYKSGTPHNQRQEKRDEVRRQIMDINDTNW